MLTLTYCLSFKKMRFSKAFLIVVALLALAQPAFSAQTPPAAQPSTAQKSAKPIPTPTVAAPEKAVSPAAKPQQAEAKPESAQNAAQNAEQNPEQDATQNSEQEAANALPESTSKSAGYVKTFDISGTRDPFSKIVKNGDPQEDTTWWNEAAEATEEEEEQEPGEFRFDGRNKPTHASYARLPLIKVTGFMQVGGRRAVSANIQNKGVCILYENDNVVIEANNKTNLSKWLVIKKIHLNGMTVVLDDGIEITGKFY